MEQRGVNSNKRIGSLRQKLTIKSITVAQIAKGLSEGFLSVWKYFHNHRNYQIPKLIPLIIVLKIGGIDYVWQFVDAEISKYFIARSLQQRPDNMTAFRIHSFDSVDSRPAEHVEKHRFNVVLSMMSDSNGFSSMTETQLFKFGVT